MILKNEDELGLSDKQTAKIKELMLKSKKEEIMKSAEIEVIALDVKFSFKGTEILWKNF